MIPMNYNQNPDYYQSWW